MKAPLFLTVSCLLTPLFCPTVLAQSRPLPQVVSGVVVECPMPLAPGEIEGETIICGQIQVPESWSDPDSPLLTLTYARQVSYNQSPIADPIIFFAGGPGGSVLASQGSSGFDFTFLRQTRDVIVWDQRGNRYSADLRCPQTVAIPNMAARDAARAALGEANFTVQSDPQTVLDWARQSEAINGTGRCADYFAAEGRELSQYNTVNTVFDAIALMDYLDYPSYNLFGISYGTQVALAIMAYYETNPTADLPPIRSAVIDGVYPQNIAGAEEALTAPYNILRVFADCEADAACGAAYPTIKQRTINLLASLEAAPIRDGRATVTLGDVRQVFNTAITTRVELIPYLPRLVDELTRGETATYAVAQGIISGQVSATAAAAAAPTNPLNPITLETASLAEDLRAIANRLDALGETTDALAAAIDEAETLPELYLSVLNRYLVDAGPEVRSTFSSQVTSVYVSYPSQQTPAGLLALSDTLDDTVAGELTAMVNLMSEAEVRTVWTALTNDEALQKLQLIDFMTNFVVKCNDRGAVYNSERAFERYRAFEAPQLIESFELVPSYQARCEIFGVDVPEYAIAPPVTSDLRTLVMNGAVDHATPVEYGELAFSTLTNATMVTVPMTDHGVTRYSKCARDIANTFFLYPDAELDTSCIEAFRPVFVLPHDPLPAIASSP